MYHVSTTIRPLTYIAIPKTGGVSVQSSGIVDEKNWFGHKRAREIENLQDYFSFTFVRNPYDKVVSSFFYWSNKGADRFLTWKKKYSTFHDFLMYYQYSTKVEKFHFDYTNFDYITNNDGEVIVDFVGKFDNIENEFIKVQKMCGIKDEKIKRLPKLNSSNHSDWRLYYTDELASIVYEKWEKDFTYFGFDKNSYKI